MSPLRVAGFKCGIVPELSSCTRAISFLSYQSRQTTSTTQVAYGASITGSCCTLTGCPFFGELSNTSIVPGSDRVTVYETGTE